MMRRLLLTAAAGATLALGVTAAPAMATPAGTAAPAAATGGWCHGRAVGDQPNCVSSSRAHPASPSNPLHYAGMMEQCKNLAWADLVAVRAMWPGHRVTSTGCYYQDGYIRERTTVWPAPGPTNPR